MLKLSDIAAAKAAQRAGEPPEKVAAKLSEVLERRVAELVESGASRSRASKQGKALRKHGVVRTGEMRRIEEIPRRRWDTDTAAAQVAREITAMLRLPGGEAPCSSTCRCPRELWENQAVALLESFTYNGLFAPIGVGKGKALISILVPVIVGAERPLLFVPAQLRDQTIRKVLPSLRRHWRTNPKLKVLGYSELSLAKNKRMLFELRPDWIILDEAHNAKNPQAARTKRIQEYLAEYPETRVVVLSGSVTRRSIKDYWKLLLWALKPDRCPLPGTWHEVTDWAMALDEGVMPQDRLAPGALLRFCEPGEDARNGYRRRLTETGGVVATNESELAVSLVIQEHPVRVPGHVLGMMSQMRKTWETPYGELITEPVELWRHMRELACGFYYRWEPAPPRYWLDARKEWKKFVRETLRHNRRGLDSELLVARECERAETPIEEYENWRAVRDEFKINTVAEWVSDFAIEAAAEWLREEEGIAWIEHVAFGERLAELSGFPYFGAGMEASSKILDATGSIIASQSAHGEGKNLQRWWRNLITAPSSSGKTWEQLAGRTHRHGQESDEVVMDTWQHADELKASLRQACADARYIEDTIGARQKLCYADIAIDLGGAL